jgi:hypothetical protein
MGTSLFIDALGYGVFGLALYAFAEKFPPVIPSSAFLIVVGMAAGGQPATSGFHCSRSPWARHWEQWLCSLLAGISTSIGSSLSPPASAAIYCCR